MKKIFVYLLFLFYTVPVFSMREESHSEDDFGPIGKIENEQRLLEAFDPRGEEISERSALFLDEMPALLKSLTPDELQKKLLCDPERTLAIKKLKSFCFQAKAFQRIRDTILMYEDEYRHPKPKSSLITLQTKSHYQDLEENKCFYCRVSNDSDSEPDRPLKEEVAEYAKYLDEIMEKLE